MTRILKRGFVAIVPPAEVLDAIDGLLERPKKSLFAWTRRDQWHVTLQFYGRVDDPRTLLEGDRGGGRPSHRRAFVVRGGGAFPNRSKAQVFWLGIDSTDALIDLHATVAAANGDFIDRRDRIALEPHLTLARLKRPWTSPRTLRRSPACRSARCGSSPTRPAGERHHARGAVYTEHARFPLGG